MTRNRVHLLTACLALLCVAVMNQSCSTTNLFSYLFSLQYPNLVKKAINKGILDFGGYSIDNVTEEISSADMEVYLESKNYVVLNSEQRKYGLLKSIQFVPKNQFHSYYYKQYSGKYFTNAKKAKCCILDFDNHPEVREIYWSGEVIDGYINGKGYGLNCNNLVLSKKSLDATGSFCVFEGEYVYGIPVSDVKYDFIDMNKVRDYQYTHKNRGIESYTFTKKDANYYLVEHKDKLDKVMLDHFVSGKANLESERFKKSVNDIRRLIANYKSYAEDIILNDKTPLLSQEIGGLSPVQVPLMSRDRIILFDKSDNEYNRRHTLEAFKNFEGVDMKIIEETDKELLSFVQKSLINDIDETFKYMALLDGLSLTTPDNIRRAKRSYNSSLISYYGTPTIERSNYFSVLENAQNIAKELKNASTGKLREKYAAAEQKINDCRKTIRDERNRVYHEVEESDNAYKKQVEKQKYEIDWDRSVAPSGELVDLSLLSSYKKHEKDGRIYTKSGGYYCVYNIVYTPDKKVYCYRIQYCSKEINIKEKDYKSLDELVAAFVNAI